MNEETEKENLENQEAIKEQGPADSDNAEKKTDQQPEKAQAQEPDKGKPDSRPGARGQRQKGRGRGPAPLKDAAAQEFLEKVVAINRVTKVTKGGKKLSFSALVVVGDAKGRVGYNLNKAGEVAVAIQKALAKAKRNMITVPLHRSTIPHEIIGGCAGAKVLLKPAAEGTGVIAAGPVRAVCDAAGIHNILTKCHRSNNPINVVKATIDGLSRLKSNNQNGAGTDNQESKKDATA